MIFKKSMMAALKELIVPELSLIKDDLNTEKIELNNEKEQQVFTNKRLDDMNHQLVDQSRRIDAVREELNHRLDETNNRIDRLYEVIVRRDEHSGLEQKVLELERDVREIKLKIAV